MDRTSKSIRIQRFNFTGRKLQAWYHLVEDQGSMEQTTRRCVILCKALIEAGVSCAYSPNHFISGGMNVIFLAYTKSQASLVGAFLHSS